MNEYRLLLPSGVVLFVIFLFFYIQLEFISLRYRKTNKILYSYLLQILMVEIAVVAFVSFFVMSQSFMTVKLLRYLYTVIGEMAVLYYIYKTIRMVKAMNHSQKFQEGINEWIKTYQKYLILGVVAIWFVNMLMRVFNGSGERFNLTELFLPLLPVIPIALSFLLPSLIKIVTKVYYLNPYSENFRQKFNVPEEVWYGGQEIIKWVK